MDSILLIYVAGECTILNDFSTVRAWPSNALIRASPLSIHDLATIVLCIHYASLRRNHRSYERP